MLYIYKLTFKKLSESGIYIWKYIDSHRKVKRLRDALIFSAPDAILKKDFNKV